MNSGDSEPSKTRVSDLNQDGITTGNEIFNTTIVTHPYYVEGNADHTNIKVYRYDEKNNAWSDEIKNFVFPKQDEEGISDSLLLFKYTNEYGNTLSKVVQYIGQNSLSSDNIVKN